MPNHAQDFSTFLLDVGQFARENLKPGSTLSFSDGSSLEISKSKYQNSAVNDYYVTIKVKDKDSYITCDFETSDWNQGKIYRHSGDAPPQKVSPDEFMKIITTNHFEQHLAYWKTQNETDKLKPRLKNYIDQIKKNCSFMTLTDVMIIHNLPLLNFKLEQDEKFTFYNDKFQIHCDSNGNITDVFEQKPQGLKRLAESDSERAKVLEEMNKQFNLNYCNGSLSQRMFYSAVYSHMKNNYKDGKLIIPANKEKNEPEVIIELDEKNNLLKVTLHRDNSTYRREYTYDNEMHYVSQTMRDDQPVRFNWTNSLFDSKVAFISQKLQEERVNKANSQNNTTPSAKQTLEAIKKVDEETPSRRKEGP
ncbi:MAG: hypothetical protein A3F18_05145 [Legionellales bacterium RIFCSPHIGHO2_12_FULL_37_14]|nr:MAG: hypothetical protein A3F18_05145 [Legionellales bacterium RIFCSPHIGHO2_12_FULL_37_14]